MDISYSFVPEQPVIMMTDNVGYHSSAAGVSVVPALNPAYTKSSEPDHLYEEFPEDVTIEKETSTSESGADKGDGYYNVNNEVQPEGPTNDPRRRQNNDDKYYENNNLFPEGANPAQTSDKMEKKKISENDYVNDDLFPEGSGRTQPTGRTKKKEDNIDQSRNDQSRSVDMERKENHREEN